MDNAALLDRHFTWLYRDTRMDALPTGAAGVVLRHLQVLYLGHQTSYAPGGTAHEAQLWDILLAQACRFGWHPGWRRQGSDPRLFVDEVNAGWTGVG